MRGLFSSGKLFSVGRGGSASTTVGRSSGGRKAATAGPTARRTGAATANAKTVGRSSGATTYSGAPNLGSTTMGDVPFVSGPTMTGTSSGARTTQTSPAFSRTPIRRAASRPGAPTRTSAVPPRATKSAQSRATAAGTSQSVLTGAGRRTTGRPTPGTTTQTPPDFPRTPIRPAASRPGAGTQTSGTTTGTTTQTPITPGGSTTNSDAPTLRRSSGGRLGKWGKRAGIGAAAFAGGAWVSNTGKGSTPGNQNLYSKPPPGGMF